MLSALSPSLGSLALRDSSPCGRPLPGFPGREAKGSFFSLQFQPVSEGVDAGQVQITCVPFPRVLFPPAWHLFTPAALLRGWFPSLLLEIPALLQGRLVARPPLTLQPEMVLFSALLGPHDPVLLIVLCGQVPVTVGRESSGFRRMGSGLAWRQGTHLQNSSTFCIFLPSVKT